MTLRPICEPVELPPGASVIAERVATDADAPASGHFLHFHDVSELVLFGRVSGGFMAAGRRFPLAEGAVAYAPSMRHHDFALAPGEKEWSLIQIDPYIVEHLAHQPSLFRLSRPFCVMPDAVSRNRIDVLGDWLIDVVAHNPFDPLIGRIVELLLCQVASAPEIAATEPAGDLAQVERLLPAVEQLRRDPSAALSLDSAASLCRLSPAYFSRCFKRVFGMNFTDYARAYRLHLAARRIATSGAPVSKIAYGLGFSSPSHFSARFRERFGMTPREYRRSARKRRSVEVV
jgi:AraC-like DNA-binding protein